MGFLILTARDEKAESSPSGSQELGRTYVMGKSFLLGGWEHAGARQGLLT